MSTALRSASLDNADDRISAVALVRPNEPALIVGDRHVAFSELEAQTDSIAACLLDRGVGAGDVVAVCLNSCLEVVPTIRAVLRLGAIFVPLDPEHPNERITYVLNDAEARVLITREALRPRLARASRPILNVESIDPVTSPVPRADVSLEHPACILYTSGSTGQPKGVLRLHRGIASRLAWGPYAADDVFCHNMSLSYGFSQERIFLPLMCGMPLAILLDECQKDAARFAQEVEKSRVTQITVVPAVLEQLVDSQRRLYTYLQAVRSVTVGSAFLPLHVIDRFHEVLPHARLINVYGSTESGTLTRGDMVPGSEPNVGWPAPNMEVFILDEQLQPVPIGQVGEIYGGGPSLAGGYWRQPELTAERFIDNPFRTGVPVLYRTGDRGRFLPDGRVQLIGRADRQVKVRGYRVELAEVENALLALSDLLEAAVISQPLGHDNRLIAYVCPRSPNTVTVSRLRQHLLRHLPAHMLPSAFVFLETLPRTPLGKLDSSSLPSPGNTRPDLENPYVAPQTLLEDQIASIWAEVLEKDCVGRDDHFIDLGGDSILAVEIAAAMEERLGIRIGVVSLFERPTVAEIAALCHDAQ